VDTNGTRFHQLLGRADWSRCVPDAGIAISDVLTLKPLLLQLPGSAATSADPVASRRGADRDRYNNWYWVDPTQSRILVQSSGTGTVSDFWPADVVSDPPPADAFVPVDTPALATPCRFGGLCVTEDHYLLIGTLDEPGLLIFDLHAGGLPRHLRWPGSVPFQPFDLARRPGGGAFVLDRVNRRYWTLDRHLGIVAPPGAPPPPELFTPAAGGVDDLRPPPVGFPAGTDLGQLASPLAAIDPVAIEALPDGTVLILDRTLPALVHRYNLAQLMTTVTLDLSSVLPAPPPPGQQLFGADLAFVAGSARAGDRVYVPSADGTQGYAFSVTWQDAPLTLSPTGGSGNTVPFLPMRLFGQKALVAADSYAWYDFDGRTFVPLIEQRRPRYVLEGTVEIPALDGREPGCVWHRLFLDGCLPPQTTIDVWSRTADELADLPRAPWAPEPTPRRRASGAELPLLPPPTSDQATVLELLFQRARGRYLQLKLRLRGDGRASPSLHSLRVWYPRFSYLDRYMPAVYRDDLESASFLDRFLANLEGIFTTIEDKVMVARLLLDARTAPSDALDWLAGWFGVALDPAWSEARRRLFLRHAMDFFQMRGTARGLIAALRLVIDDCADDSIFTDTSPLPAGIRVLEWFRLRTQTALSLGDPSATAGIRAVLSPPAWTPEQGGAVLTTRYRSVLAAAGLDASFVAFPVFEPVDGTGPMWRRFIQDTLALSSTAAASDSASWQAFLTARYPSLDAFNAAWGTHVADFNNVALPSSLPPDGAPLLDWYQFQLGGGRYVPSGTRWVPALGGDALTFRWHQAESAAGLAATDFPLAAPSDDTSTLWQDFCNDTLGFVPSAGTREQLAWSDFLLRRYRRIAALNLAYGTSYSGFDDPTLTLPTQLPSDGVPLVDWHDFFSIVMATRNNAHRFTVLLPVPASEAFDVSLHEERRQLATRIIDLEKPAHTLFDVKFYWAMFRIGFARLELDTLLDVGSRAPELLPPMVLDQGFLAESHLQGVPPERDQERRVVGQHALRARNTAEKTS
jgi:phage tail-like protein